MPAEVIVEVALSAAGGAPPVLSYRVPPHLQGLVRPGQLVWAPLRHGQAQGVVLRLAAPAAPAERLRDLIGLADPEAVITETGLRLAAWVATTYRAPLYAVLSLLLPPGTGQKSTTTWRATPAGLNVELRSLPERERAILYYLRTRGELDEATLRRALRGSDAELRSAYAALAERGLIVAGAATTPPRVRPRLERLVRLEAPLATLPETLEALRRAPRQRAVLEWLAARHTEGQDPTPRAHPLAELYAATGANAALLRALERRGLVTLETREVQRDPLRIPVPPDQPPPLTPAQRAAYEAIVEALEASARQEEPASPGAPVFLLHGITGSGKTEIYLRAIARTLRLGRQALVLVPEIALTAQLVRRFAARFPGQLAVLHSGLGLGERYDAWRRLRHGEATVAIGSRSAVFAPLERVGLVIVDEEHELSYKHEGGPRYHARDTALQLAALSGAVTLLGSATPAVESYHAAREGRYHLLELPERVGGAVGADGLPRSRTLPLPPVRIVDMRNELQQGNASIFSHPLQQALAATLARGEQAMLFLNRRGAASFVMCRDCGYVATCATCSNPLTVHYAGETGDEQATVLVCHACGARAALPVICPHCLSARVRSFGIGTQRVAEEVRALFPSARVLRWDRDSASARGAHERLLDALLRHEADVIVGTQMIAKGLDLPLVTLVGVVAADTGLHLPDFRSGERAFQLLTQVAGRAGRRFEGAQVLIQTYNPEHYALLAAQEHDYRRFFTQEIAFCRATGYPPFSRLVRLVHAAENPRAARREAERLADRARALLQRRELAGWSLIGPAPALIQRARGRWRWHLILRAAPPADERAINAALDALEPLYGWSVDVDPVHVL
ncbi:MAG: primosomal protein N' [Chloroflexaceae bacterium]|nr:primosomal protein N' [Chloroflexaceae bacterium]